MLLTEPQELIVDAIVAGVTVSGFGSNEGKVARAWIVLSDKGKKFGADAVIKELKVWYEQKLSNHKWLHGGIEIVDEVCVTLVFNKPSRAIQIFNVDSQVNIGQALKSGIAEKV